MIRLVHLVVLLLACVSSASAADSFTPLFLAAAADLHVPGEWTQAIAQVESKRNPFTLNIEGKGYVFDSKEEALAAARQAQLDGRSFDSGIMQVNNQWLRKYDIPLEAALDPEANIWLGSWILQQEIKRQGQNWAAVARYHSPDPVRGRRYVDMVQAALNRGAVTNHDQKATKRHRDVAQTLTQATRKADKPVSPVMTPAFVVYRSSNRLSTAEQQPQLTTAFVRHMHHEE